jgi:hypothetical protein
MLTVAGALLVIAAAVTGAALIVRAALAARRSAAIRADSPLAARIAEPLPRVPLRRRPHHPRQTR